MAETLIEKIIPDPIPIINGGCTIRLDDLGLVIRVLKLKQQKGQGVHDADRLIRADELHLKILNIMMRDKIINIDRFTTRQVRYAFNENYKRQNPKWKPKDLISQAAMVRKMSELLRKKVLRYYPPRWYSLNQNLAVSILSDKDHKF